MADKIKNPITPKATVPAGEPIPTFTDLANNPAGMTKRKIVARLFEVHPYTIARWVKRGILAKPIIINKVHYFKNPDILALTQAEA